MLKPSDVFFIWLGFGFIFVTQVQIKAELEHENKLLKEIAINQLLKEPKP